MRVVLDAVGKGRREHALPVTSTAYASGTATLVVAETEQRPTVLGLIASGRMRPDTGRVEIDGKVDASSLRRRVALVDAPEVSEPEPNVTLAGVVAEELMFAGRASHPIAVQNWLADNGLAGEASLPVSNVDPADRVRALCELAVLRKGVEGLVLVSPDRHGGEPEAWWAIAEDFAARGFAVLVIAGRASAPVAVPVPAIPVVERPRNEGDETSQPALENDPPAAPIPVVERARNERGETSQPALENNPPANRRVSSAGARAPFAQRPRVATAHGPRLRRLTARTRGGRA